MTVSANDRRKEYPGNGITTAFDGPRAFSDSHIAAYLVDDASGVATLTTDYTLTRVGGRTATLVTMNSAVASGTTLLILRTVPYSQETDITNQGAYLPEVVERMADLLGQQTQQLADRAGRTLEVSETAVLPEGFDSSLPTPAADHYVKVKADRTGFEYTDDAVPNETITDAKVAAAAAIKASKLSHTAGGTGSVARTVAAKLGDFISVRDKAVTGDGVDDDLFGVRNAVADAYTGAGWVFWPAGTYNVSGNIPNFHDVQHFGPGIFKRGTSLFPISPKESDAIGLFVATTGDDTNDGLTAIRSFATIQKAIDVIASRGHVRGQWTINLAAGTYTEALSFGSLLGMEAPIDIRGPDVGGHPNVPTAIIAAPTVGSTIFSASEGGWFRLYDVLLRDAPTGTAINLNSKSRVTATNVHIANCLNGVLAQHCALITPVGGVWDGNNLVGGCGLRTLYNATHNSSSATPAVATLIQNWETGIQVQEGGQGHLDCLRLHDCTTGLVIRRGAGACNTDSMQIYRCGVGVLAQSAWFNNNIDFGSGADACTVNARTTGGAPEFDFRCNDFRSRTMRQQDHAIPGAHTGTTTETTKYTYAVGRDWMVSEAGDFIEMGLFASNAALAGTANVRVYLNDGTSDDLIHNVLLPVGTTTADILSKIYFSAEAGQRGTITAIHNTGTLIGYGTGALSMKGKAITLKVTVTLSNAADTLTLTAAVLRTTLGG